MTDGCMGCRVPGYSHAAYCPEGRVEDLRSRLAEFERLLRGIRHNFYMAQQWADRIDAFLAANSASGVEK